MKVAGSSLASTCRDVVLCALCCAKPVPLAMLDESLRDDGALVLQAVKQHGLSLEHASERLRLDPEIARAAVTQNWRSFSFVGEDLAVAEGFKKFAREEARKQEADARARREAHGGRRLW